MSQEQVFIKDGCNVFYKFQAAKQDRKHLLVVFSGFGAKRNIIYDLNNTAISLPIGDIAQFHISLVNVEKIQMALIDIEIHLNLCLLSASWRYRAQCFVSRGLLIRSGC